MNCLAFRRQLAVDPATRDPAFRAHREECGACAEASARADGFEQSLRRALSIPVPEGLAEHVLLRQTTDQRVTARRAGPGWLALAAAVVLSLAAGAVGYHYLAPRDLGEMSVAHLPHEPQALTSRAEIPAERVREAFAHYQVALAEAPQRVNYVQNCRVGTSHAVHMVVQRDEGPVTVMFYADRKEAQRSDFRREGMAGRAVPMAQGTLVLLAAQERSFDALEAAWRESLEGGGAAIHNAAAGSL
jgi:hypothetical protein